MDWKTSKNKALKNSGVKLTPGRKVSRKTVNIREVKPARVRHDVLFRLLIICGLFALGFYAINAGWMEIRNIEVNGGIRLSDTQVISLAGLSDFEDAWTIFIPTETLERSLTMHPLVEHAEVNIAGPWTLKITVTERQPIACAEYNNCRFLFDRTGELIDIFGEQNFCLYPVVTGVPVGLLKLHGEPLYQKSEKWSLPAEITDVDSINLQFNRLIHLQRLINLYLTEKKDDVVNIRMEDNGEITVEFAGCPPILLGNFDNPDLQFRCMLAILDNETITDPRRILDIDLSSELYPCYHVRDDYLTDDELKAIADWSMQDDDTSGEDNDEPAGDSDNPDTNEADDGSHEVVIDPGIFDLAGRN